MREMNSLKKNRPGDEFIPGKNFEKLSYLKMTLSLFKILSQSAQAACRLGGLNNRN